MYSAVETAIHLERSRSATAAKLHGTEFLYSTFQLHANEWDYDENNTTENSDSRNVPQVGKIKIKMHTNLMAKRIFT